MAQQMFHPYSYRVPKDWTREVGEFVPLMLVSPVESISVFSENHGVVYRRVAKITFSNTGYMKYYSDDLHDYDYEATFVKNNEGKCWDVLSSDDLTAAGNMVERYNYLAIPFANTLEWEAMKDPTCDDILFFPTMPGKEGQQKTGDTWGEGVWDDLVRAFRFSYDDWVSTMEFQGYSYHY